MHGRSNASIQLADDLRDSHVLLNEITRSLDGNQWLGPQLTIVNPPLWELGHVAWFQERWCLRRQRDGGLGESLLPNADELYDSASVAHATRWTLPLPDPAATRRYLDAVTEATLAAIARSPDDADLRYFVRLATFHQDMHAEAFHYSRQTLGYTDPLPPTAQAIDDGGGQTGDVSFTGGEFMLGAVPADGFVFDNEKWAHRVTLAPFRMARTAVTNAEFLAFVDAGGYRCREWWSDAGWQWLQSCARAAPCYWQRQDEVWLQRRFNCIEPLPPQFPVIHINWHEANAYCRFAGRRLPTEAEWEFAATRGGTSERKRPYPWGDDVATPHLANLGGRQPAAVNCFGDGDSADGVRQMLGNVWEWTATTFNRYPGFVLDPYKEYSEPWFGTHKVLRGGSFATPARLIRNTWRNFYTPERCDIFAGFRTCAVD